MEKSRDISVHITSGSIITTLLFLTLAALLWFLRDIGLILITAVVITSAMEPAIRFLTKRRIHRVLSVILMYATVFGVFIGVLLVFVPPLLGDAANFLSRLPQTLSSLNISEATHGILPWGSVGDQIYSADLLRNISNTLSNTTGGVFTTVSAFFGGLTSFVLIVVFSFYFSVQETGVDDFLRVVTPIKEQTYVL